MNALRGVTCKDSDFAEEGIGETTFKPKKYKFKDKELKYLVFWDIPGSEGMKYGGNDVDDYFR